MIISETGYWSGPDLNHHHCRYISKFASELFSPYRTVYDLGCGTGGYLKALWEAGFSAGMLVGYEAEPPHPREWPGVYAQDLTAPFRPKFGPAQVICLEVAEHVPKKYEEGFLDNVVGALDNGCHLLFSWATPGQGGDGHVNERPNEYAIRALESRGLRLLPKLTEEARASVKLDDKAWWFRNTTMVFAK
jgi:2-polyprenyl-3-methyl-5-hydroxy-6-metoxy-1,4-benzoquinol methylase